MAGSEVRHASSITMPPRSPSASPAARANSSRGRIPAENTTRSVSSSLPSAKRTRCACRSRRRRSRPSACRCGSPTPSSSIRPRSMRPPASSICTAIRRVGEFDDVRFQTEIEERLGGLETQESTADHDVPSLASQTRASYRGQILDGPIDEAAAAITSRDGRHEGIRARCQHQPIVGKLPVPAGANDAPLAIDGDGPLGEREPDAGPLEEPGLDQRQALCGLARKKGGEMHAIIGGPGFLAQDRYLECAPARLEPLEESVPDHAVADDDQLHDQGSVIREVPHSHRSRGRRDGRVRTRTTIAAAPRSPGSARSPPRCRRWRIRVGNSRSVPWPIP